MNKLTSLFFHGSFFSRNRVSLKRGLVLLLFLVGVEVWGVGKGTERLYPAPILFFSSDSGSVMNMTDAENKEVLVRNDGILLRYRPLGAYPMPFSMGSQEEGGAIEDFGQAGDLLIPEPGTEESDALQLCGQLAIEIPVQILNLQQVSQALKQNYYFITINLRPDEAPWDFLPPAYFKSYLDLLVSGMTDQQLQEAIGQIQEGKPGFRRFMQSALDSRILQGGAAWRHADQIYPKERRFSIRLQAVVAYLSRWIKAFNSADDQGGKPAFIIAVTGLPNGALKDFVPLVKKCLVEGDTMDSSVSSYRAVIAAGRSVSLGAHEQDHILQTLTLTLGPQQSNESIVEQVRDEITIPGGIASVVVFPEHVLRKGEPDVDIAKLPGQFNTGSIITVPLEGGNNFIVTYLDIESKRNRQQLKSVLEKVGSLQSGGGTVLVTGRLNTAAPNRKGQMELLSLRQVTSPEKSGNMMFFPGSPLQGFFLNPYGVVKGREEMLDGEYDYFMGRIEEENHRRHPAPPEFLVTISGYGSVGKGKHALIYGPSGSGKSYRLHQAYKQTLEYFKKDKHDHGRASVKVKMAGRKFRLDHHKDNLSTTENSERLYDLLSEELNRHPEIKALFIDELDTGLTPDSARKKMQALKRVAKQKGVVLVSISHHGSLLEKREGEENLVDLPVPLSAPEVAHRQDLSPPGWEKVDVPRPHRPSKLFKSFHLQSGEVLSIAPNIKVSLMGRLSIESGRIYLIRGEPNVGKTRTLRSLINRLPDPSMIHEPNQLARMFHREPTRESGTVASLINTSPLVDPQRNPEIINALQRFSIMVRGKDGLSRALKPDDLLGRPWGLALSDGQLNRLGIIRTLLSNRKAILLDQLLAGLSDTDIPAFLGALREHIKESGQVVVATANNWNPAWDSHVDEFWVVTPDSDGITDDEHKHEHEQITRRKLMVATRVTTDAPDDLSDEGAAGGSGTVPALPPRPEEELDEISRRKLMVAEENMDSLGQQEWNAAVLLLMLGAGGSSVKGF